MIERQLRSVRRKSRRAHAEAGCHRHRIAHRRAILGHGLLPEIHAPRRDWRRNRPGGPSFDQLGLQTLVIPSVRGIAWFPDASTVQSRLTSGPPPLASRYAKRPPSGRMLMSQCRGDACSGSAMRVTSSVARARSMMMFRVPSFAATNRRDLVPGPLRCTPAVPVEPRKGQDLSRAAANRGHDEDPHSPSPSRKTRCRGRSATSSASDRWPDCLRQVHRLPAAEPRHPDIDVREGRPDLVRLVGRDAGRRATSGVALDIEPRGHLNRGWQLQDAARPAPSRPERSQRPTAATISATTAATVAATS